MTQPAVVAVRWIGLLARHVRQARIASKHSHMNGDHSPGPSAAAPFSPSAGGEQPAPLERSRSRQSLADAAQAVEATGVYRNERVFTQNSNESMTSIDSYPLTTTSAFHPLWERVDRILLQCRLDSTWPQLVAVVLLCIPRMLFYFVRLLMPADYPDYSNPTHVGCMYDDTVRPCKLAGGIILPCVARLARHHRKTDFSSLPPCCYWPLSSLS